MKLKRLVPALALFAAVLSAFAFRSVEHKRFFAINCTYYDFLGGDPFDPNNYQLANPQPSIFPYCADPDNQLCAVCVKAVDIYESGDWAGLPKVNDENSNIHDQLEAALAADPLADIFITSNAGADLEFAIEFKP